MSENTTKNKLNNKPEEKPGFLARVVDILSWVLMLMAVCIMVFTVVSVNTFDRNDRSIFGYKALIVRSDSMSATDFSAGDLILVKDVDPAMLGEGDIIAFKSADPSSFGETFTHKIRSKTTADGEPAFITYGTTTGVDDVYPVKYNRIQGKYFFALKGVGTFFNFLKTVPGYICCIFVPFMLLIIMQGVTSIKLFKQYKAEQMAELEEKRKKELDEMAAEREKLIAEREESQKLLAELRKMKEEMAALKSDTETTTQV